MPLQVQRQIVLARLNVQALEPAVEVVNNPREIAVDEHLGLARRHLQLQRRPAGVETQRVLDDVGTSSIAAVTKGRSCFRM